MVVVDVTDGHTAALLLKRIKLAVPEREKHVAAYAEFTRALPRLDTEKWEAMVTTWEAAPTTAPNPYDLVRSRKSLLVFVRSEC